MDRIAEVIKEFARYTGLNESIDSLENPVCFNVNKEGDLFIETRDEDVFVYFTPDLNGKIVTSSDIINLLKNNYYKRGAEIDINIGLSKEEDLVFIVKLRPEDFTFQTLDRIFTILLNFKKFLE